MRKSEYKRYPLNQCALYKCKSKKKLAVYMGTDLCEIKMVLDTMKYHSFQIPKKNGIDMRDITSPCVTLKRTQKRILRLLERIDRPDWLMSGEKGKSYITNAKYHSNNQYCLTADISCFYDNCKREYVYSFFKNKLQCSPDVSKTLTDLITWNNGIPTGTPTSQLIAYYAYEEMFFAIKELSQQYGLTFSLYVDDMTFSGNSNFNIGKFIFELRAILKRYGHSLKKSKTKYYSKNRAKIITGVAVLPNFSLGVANTKRMQIVDLFYSCSEVKDKKAIESLKGKICSAKQIQPQIFPELTKKVIEMDMITK